MGLFEVVTGFTGNRTADNNNQGVGAPAVLKQPTTFVIARLCLALVQVRSAPRAHVKSVPREEGKPDLTMFC